MKDSRILLILLYIQGVLKDSRLLLLLLILLYIQDVVKDSSYIYRVW